MNTHIDLTTSASRLTRQMLIDMKAARDSDSLAHLSNVELLLLLSASGCALHREEIYAVTRDFLIDRAPAICKASGRAVDSVDHDAMIDRFLEDLLHYVESEELQVAIAEGISEERHADMRAEFARRMNKTAALGLHSVRSEPEVVQRAAPNPIMTVLPKVSGLCATAITLAFCSWVVVEAPVQAASTTIRRLATPQPGTPVRKSPSGKVSPMMQKQIRSLDSSDPQERAVALDWLASHGAAVPASIRAQLRSRLILENALLRWEAAWLIGSISSGAAEDVKALTATLRDRDPRVWSVAALGLGRIGPAAASALPALRQRSGQSADAASACISGEIPEFCDEIKKLFDQKAPLLQLMIEHQLDQERRPMGVCMCSFLAAQS